jgi:ubiquinone/menaquinone biosynthesis C-methylase UbiE
VLEVGCGSARDSVALAGTGRKVVVLDAAPSALSLALAFARESGVRLRAVRGDARYLPFREASFGTVFHQGVLEHFLEPGAVLRENHRVLQENGTLLVDVPQTFHPWTLLKRILIPLGLWFGGWETQYTPKGIAREVSRPGFTVLKVYGEWMHPSLAYRLLRELGRRTKLFHLPLFPPDIGMIRLARWADRTLTHGAIELWTGYVVGVLAAKRP